MRTFTLYDFYIFAWIANLELDLYKNKFPNLRSHKKRKIISRVSVGILKIQWKNPENYPTYDFLSELTI